jgi:hypothetical protein
MKLQLKGRGCDNVLRDQGYLAIKGTVWNNGEMMISKGKPKKL